MPNVCSFDRCESCGVDWPCPAADYAPYFQGQSASLAVDLALSCILLVFSMMAFRRFLSKPGSSLCRWTAHQTFHLSHVVFCVLRIITDALFIAEEDTNDASQAFLYATIGDVFQDLMFVAGTFMWLSLMCFWYQVTMPSKALLKAFNVLATHFRAVHGSLGREQRSVRNCSKRR